MLKKECWDFKVWKAFNNKLFKDYITQENLSNGGEEENYEAGDIGLIRDGQKELVPFNQSMLVVKAEKNNEKYLLHLDVVKHLPIRITSYMKCVPKRSDKKVYRLVGGMDDNGFDIHKGYVSANLAGEKQTDFRTFIDTWNPMEHSNPRDWTLIKLIAIASKHKGIKLCLCSEPRTGKNSNFSIMNQISQDVCRIQKPTLAKLQTVLFYNSVILPDEFTSIEPVKVREIEPTILQLGDNSTEYNKHSMAQDKKLNVIDITNKSIIFTYNRVCDIGKGNKFFDFVWNNTAAIRDRYPMMLLSGQVTEHMRNLSAEEANKLVDENFDQIKSVVKNYLYWTRNITQSMHKYSRSYIDLPNRHMHNFEGVLDVLDVYCSTQEEYDDWLIYILNKFIAYRLMVATIDEEKQDEPTVEGQQKIQIVKYPVKTNIDSKLKTVESDLI